MDGIEIKMGYLLNTAARLIKWEFGVKLKEYDLTTSQWAVLKDLHAREGLEESQNTTPASIAERLHADRPTVSGIIERLEVKGLVARTVNPEDKRSQIITLTDESKELIPMLEKLSDAAIEKAVKGFSPVEIEDLQASLVRIINNLKD